MSLDVLGPAVPAEELLQAVVRSVLDDDTAVVIQAAAHAVDYPTSSPATGGLHRVAGTARLGSGAAVAWSVFVKTLRHASLSARYKVLPHELAASFAAEFPWRWELDRYRSEEGRLPAGLRTPMLHAVDEMDDKHCVLWMEDVQQSPVPWDVQRYARAARALGRLAAARSVERLPELSPLPVGYAMRKYVIEYALRVSSPPLRDDRVWSSPPLVSVVDDALRGDLLRLEAEAGRWLDRLDTLPQTLAHGDASPQNLLVPVTDDGFVLIDWGFGSPLAVGFDLGQLLLGLVQVGEADAAALPAVHAAILPAYLEGLADEGLAVEEDVVRFGYVASMVLRSALDGLMWERLTGPDTPALRGALRQRATMTRFVVDLGLAELEAGPARA